MIFFVFSCLQLLSVLLLVGLTRNLKCLGAKIMADLASLEEQIKRNTDVDSSAILLIQGIAEQLRQAGTDPVKLAELRDKLSQSTDALAAAVTANTPAA